MISMVVTSCMNLDDLLIAIPGGIIRCDGSPSQCIQVVPQQDFGHSLQSPISLDSGLHSGEWFISQARKAANQATWRFAIVLACVLIALLTLAGCSTVPELNSGLEYSFQAVNLVDIAQTLHGPASDSCYVEEDPITRPLIGPHPSATAVIADGVGYAVAQYEASRWLNLHGHPYLATAFEVVTLGLSARTVGHNYQVGIRIGAPNTDQGYQRECEHR